MRLHAQFSFSSRVRSDACCAALRRPSRAPKASESSVRPRDIALASIRRQQETVTPQICGIDLTPQESRCLKPFQVHERLSSEDALDEVRGAIREYHEAEKRHAHGTRRR